MNPWLTNADVSTESRMSPLTDLLKLAEKHGLYNSDVNNEQGNINSGLESKLGGMIQVLSEVLLIHHDLELVDSELRRRKDELSTRDIASVAELEKKTSKLKSLLENLCTLEQNRSRLLTRLKEQHASSHLVVKLEHQSAFREVIEGAKVFIDEMDAKRDAIQWHEMLIRECVDNNKAVRSLEESLGNLPSLIALYSHYINYVRQVRDTMGRLVECNSR